MKLQLRQYQIKSMFWLWVCNDGDDYDNVDDMDESGIMNERRWLLSLFTVFYHTRQSLINIVSTMIISDTTLTFNLWWYFNFYVCLLYTSDAADE